MTKESVTPSAESLGPIASRGWNLASAARPAADIPVEFGSELLRERSSDWPPYLLVTSGSAHDAARSRLEQEPRAVCTVASLDRSHLEQLAEAMPDVSLVVGLGGGRVIDAAKYFAVAKYASLIQIPSILSSGAIIHGYCATYEGRTAIGGRDEWVWADCEYVLIDYGLVLSAPPNLNTAGLGDVLCEHSGIAEWRRSNRGAETDDHERRLIERLVAFHEEIADDFAASLGADGLTEASVRCIMRALQRRDAHRVFLDDAPNVDHYLLNELELAFDRSWVHGEVVALGALVVTWMCDGDAAEFADLLDRCQVRWRPEQLGIERGALEVGLERVRDYLAREGDSAEGRSVMRSSTLESDRLGQLWNFLESVDGGQRARSPGRVKHS